MAKSFARIEADFVFGDARFIDLSAYEKALYLMLWIYSVQQRRQRHAFKKGTRSIAHATRMDHRYLPDALQKLRASSLIDWDGETYLTVYGVKDNHKRLSGWKDSYSPEHVGESRVDKSRVDVSRNETGKSDALQDLISAWTIDRRCTEYEAGRAFMRATEDLISQGLCANTEAALDFLVGKVCGFMRQCHDSGQELHKGVVKWVQAKGYLDTYRNEIKPQGDNGADAELARLEEKRRRIEEGVEVES